MATLVLNNLDTSKEAVVDFLLETLGQKLTLAIPLYGHRYTTEKIEIQHQLLLAASVGEGLFDYCSEIEYATDEIDGREVIIFELVPLDLVTFVDRLWEVAVPYMAEEMWDALGYDDVAVAEFRSAAGDLLEADESSLHFPELMALIYEFAPDEEYDQ